MNYGIEYGFIREPAQVIMHLPEDWTKILLVRTYGLGIADGGIYWDIPTETIPARFRRIGCRFVMSGPIGRADVPPAQGRGKRGYTEFQFDDIPESDRGLWPTPKA